MITFICTQTTSPSDQEYMLWLYDEFKELMFFTARKYLLDSQAVEDIVHDSIVKLLRKVSVLRPMTQSMIAGYVASTVRNTAIDYLRKAKTIESRQSEYEVENLDGIQSLDDLIVSREASLELRKIWSQLSITDQLLLEGKYILGYSDGELAAQLGCSDSSIRMKLTRARRRALAMLTQNKEVIGLE